MTVAIPTATLEDICDLNPRLAEPLGPDTPVSFVPMSSVSAEMASTIDNEDRHYSEVAKGYTPMLNGDVLVAKITPCFENGKIAQATLRRQIGFGSTEFHVIRPHEGKADARYLLHFLRQERITQDGKRRMTGSAGQRRVPIQFLAGLEIPIPPLPEQRRIAAILDQADALRAKRREAISQVDALAQSIFLDMFGDPRTNPKGWTKSKVGDEALQLTDGEHQTPKRTAEGIKLLSARNVRDGYIDFENVDFISLGEHERIKRRCNPTRGDVLISCSGSIGRVACVDTDEPFSLVRSAALVRPNRRKLHSRFLEHYLGTPALKALMVQRANASSQANLFQNQIRDLPLFLPPTDLQDKFGCRVEAVNRLRRMQSESCAQFNALFASLQHRAFRGEL